ncbi:hypothetical protein B7P43_G18352 [Cryptotermes secundus]|uniref:Mos1 transposase HTH domain-containing protein n=1 Tax=Cryptotermes secundus TaxID=105785 RepID=A0A2J7QDU8_9NEOP|nr:hypothetical protein B7P43_G18352 [Cryptotermes secundus]
MFSKQEQQSWINTECARGPTARQCHQGLHEACGESACLTEPWRSWVKAFNEGRQNVADMRRPGRPSVSEEVYDLSALLERDRRRTIRELVPETALAHTTVLHFLKEGLGMRKCHVGNAEIFRADFTTFRGDRSARGYVPKKMLSKNPDPEYYNREVKRLKVKVRKAYHRSKYRQNYHVELKRLSRELLLAKKRAQETFLSSVLQNVGRSWPEFYKYVKRRRRNREIIPAIKDSNGKPVTEPVEKANILNSYYASIFSSERNDTEIQLTDSSKSFTVDIVTAGE